MLMPEDQRASFNQALADHDFEQAVELLDQAIPDGVACPSQIFILSDTDTGDPELQEAFRMPSSTKTTCTRNGRNRTLLRLREAVGEAPTAHSWTIWG